MPVRSVFARACLLVAVCLGAPALHAAGLYSAVVPVDSQNDAERAGALKTALAQVVVRLSGGDDAILARPEVAQAIGDAAQYVQQYQYQRDVADDNGKPQVHLTLLAQFDPDAVDKLLANLGLQHAAAGTEASQAAVDVQPQQYRVWVSGVNSAMDYAKAVGVLSRNDLVRSAQAEQTRGDGVELRLEVTGPLSRLLASLGGSGLRVLNAQPPLEGVDALLGVQP